MCFGDVLTAMVTPFHEDGSVKDWYTIADGMEHPNGVRVYKNYMYVTQSYLTKVEGPDGKLVSCVYRFPLDAKDLVIQNTLEDEYIFTTFVTHNPRCQYGADGIEIDSNGVMYVGNFGDGEVWKITLDENGEFVIPKAHAISYGGGQESNLKKCINNNNDGWNNH